METPQVPVLQNLHGTPFTKFVYPFAIDLTSEMKWSPFRKKKRLWKEIVKALYENQDWNLLADKKLEYILPHVESFLYSFDSDKPIEERYAVSFTLNARTLQRKVPPQGKTELVVKRDKGQVTRYPLNFRQVDIYLFRSGVGVLVFDIKLLQGISTARENGSESNQDENPATGRKYQLTLEDLVNFNYEFRQSLREKDNDQSEMPRKRKRFIEIIKGKEESKKFILRRWMNELLHPIFNVSASVHEFYDERLLGYSYALLENQGAAKGAEETRHQYESIKDYLFWLRNYFRQTYLPPEQETKLEDNPHVLAAFGNIYFGMSMDGGGVLVWDTGDSFLRNNFSERVRKNYFVLYLLVLHQRLAAIYFAMQVSDKSINYQFKKLPAPAVLRDLKFLRAQIFEFIIKCWFADVSNMEMYSRVYRRWQDVMQVKALLQEVKNEVEELDDYFQRIQSEGEARFMNMLSWLFFPLIIMFGFWGMNFIELTQPGFSFFNPKIWLITGVGFGVYYLFVWLFKKVLK